MVDPVKTNNPVAPNMFSVSKLMKHLDKVVELQNGGNPVPVGVGIDLTNVCNHRCPMCNGAPGEMEGDRSTLPFEVLERLANDFAAMGVKAVGFGGGGDPSCHPRVAEVIRLFNSRGLEIGFITNGQLMREDLQEAVVDCCTWIRISLDADGPELFKATHGMNAGDWEKVLANARSLVALRAKKGKSLAIGTSFLIGSHTRSGIYKAAEIARDLGVDYIRMRPYFTWDGDMPFTADEADEVLSELNRATTLATDTFFVSFPRNRTEWVQGSVAANAINARRPFDLIAQSPALQSAILSIFHACKPNDAVLV